jgi:shikimate kinase
MPGVGKSTVGVLLAKATGRGFVDTDVLIQVGQGRSLQEILDADGIEAFLRIEEDYLCCLAATGSVVATGGSAVYSAKAMANLQALGVIVHLHLPLDVLARRIENLYVRGVVIARGQTLVSLYDHRRQLYEKYANLTIQCTGLTQDQVVGEILKRMP